MVVHIRGEFYMLPRQCGWSVGKKWIYMELADVIRQLYGEEVYLTDKAEIYG